MNCHQSLPSDLIIVALYCDKCVHLSVYPLAYLRNPTVEFTNFYSFRVYIQPWLGPPVAARCHMLCTSGFG